MSRRTLVLALPGIAVFVLALAVATAAMLMPLVAAIVAVTAGLWGLTVTAAILVSLAVLQWRRHWLSGLSVLCAPLLVLALAVLPHPVSSPLGWATQAFQVLYHRGELRRSYLAAKVSGMKSPVGQIYLDGFGSLTSGLAYDPSGEIARPSDKRSNSWDEGPGQTELGLKGLESHHVFGPYYQWFHY